MRNHEEFEIDPLCLLRALWRKAFLISLVTLLAAALFLLASFLWITPQYKAKALMYVNSSDISLDSTKVSISQSELSAAKTLVDTYIVIMNSRTTLDEVINQSGVSYTYEEIISNHMISASAVNGTEVFAIEVTSPDPSEAALLANTIAEVLPDKIASIVDGTSVRIVDRAVRPAAPDSPNLMKNTVIGGILGFVLACAVVVVLEWMDDLIHDPNYLLQTYELPVLAVIPDLSSNKHSSKYGYFPDAAAKKRGI